MFHIMLTGLDILLVWLMMIMMMTPMMTMMMMMMMMMMIVTPNVPRCFPPLGFSAAVISFPLDAADHQSPLP